MSSSDAALDSLTRPMSARDLRQSEVSRWQAPTMQDAMAWSDEAVSEDDDAEQWLPTAEELQALRETAREEGHAEGLAAGRKDAEQELDQERGALRQQAREQQARMESILSALAEPLADADQQVLDQLAELALTAARHVVGRELRTTPGEIMAAIRDALALLPAASPDVRVHVSADDYALLKQMDPVAEEGAGTAWRLVRDTTVSNGGCLVRSGYSVIDATIEKRLNHLFFQAVGVERRRDAEMEKEADSDPAADAGLAQPSLRRDPEGRQ